MSETRVKRINFACGHTRTTSWQVPADQVKAEQQLLGRFRNLVIEEDTNGCDDCRRGETVHGHPLRVPLHGLAATSQGYRVVPAKVLD